MENYYVRLDECEQAGGTDEHLVSAASEADAVEKFVNGGAHCTWHEESVGERVKCHVRHADSEETHAYTSVILNTYDVTVLHEDETWESTRFENGVDYVRAMTPEDAVRIVTRRSEWSDEPAVVRCLVGRAGFPAAEISLAWRDACSPEQEGYLL